MCSKSTFIQVHQGLTGTSMLIRATVTNSQKYAYVLGWIRRPLTAYRFQSDPDPVELARSTRYDNNTLPPY